MTREEAVVILKCVMPDSSIRLAARDEEIKEAMNMAIKALEQEPCEDAVSRQAVLDMMQMKMDGKELYNAVYGMQSVTPQPEIRRWTLTSEELPKSDGHYTVIEKSGRVGTYVFHKEGNSEEYLKRCTVAWLKSEDSGKKGDIMTSLLLN